MQVVNNTVISTNFGFNLVVNVTDQSAQFNNTFKACIGKSPHQRIEICVAMQRKGPAGLLAKSKTENINKARETIVSYMSSTQLCKHPPSFSTDMLCQIVHPWCNWTNCGRGFIQKHVRLLYFSSAGHKTMRNGLILLHKSYRKSRVKCAFKYSQHFWVFAKDNWHELHVE